LRLPQQVTRFEVAIINAESHFAQQLNLGRIEPKAITRVKLSQEAQNKIIDEIIASKGTRPGDVTRGMSTQYIKLGSYEDALKDFDRLELDGVNDFAKRVGRSGDLLDGRRVNVRPYSSSNKGMPNCEDGLPTLEILNKKTGDKIKWRYEN
jgi:hypothetical protein